MSRFTIHQTSPSTASTVRRSIESLNPCATCITDSSGASLQGQPGHGHLGSYRPWRWALRLPHKESTRRSYSVYSRYTGSVSSAILQLQYHICTCTYVYIVDVSIDICIAICGCKYVSTRKCKEIEIGYCKMCKYLHVNVYCIFSAYCMGALEVEDQFSRHSSL